MLKQIQRCSPAEARMVVCETTLYKHTHTDHCNMFGLVLICCLTAFSKQTETEKYTTIECKGSLLNITTNTRRNYIDCTNYVMSTTKTNTTINCNGTLFNVTKVDRPRFVNCTDY
ncbi:Hypothetical protein EIN_328440, partial [Entamoeba invadens IP1]